MDESKNRGKIFSDGEIKFNDIDHEAWRLWEGSDLWMSADNIVPFPQDDMVNSPAHYKKGRVEAIDVIEDAIEEAPSTKAGFLQAQVLKYLLRLWHKIDAKEDAEKARWYLNRLIDSLN